MTHSKNNLILYSFLLFIFITISAVGITSAQQDEGVPVIVATQPLERGTVLLPDMLYGDNPVVELQYWQADLAPQTAFRRLEDIEGLVTRLDITTRMPLLAGNLVPEATRAAPIGSDAALLLPSSQRGVPLRVDNLFSAPSTLTELDCVSVTAVFDFRGEDLDTYFTLATNGIIVENIANTNFVTIALNAEAGLTAIWMQEHGIPLALAYSEACVPS